nr:maltoporin [Raoultella sp. NCTC 9187]
MRISVISAAVCCALFSAYGVCAAPLTIEQRLAQLEARLNHAEQEAGDANRRAQQSEQRTTAAEQRAAAAEKQVQALSQRTAASEQKQQVTNQQINSQLAKTSPGDGFEFNAYARSGMLVDSHGKGARGPGDLPCQLAQRRCPRWPSRQREG